MTDNFELVVEHSAVALVPEPVVDADAAAAVEAGVVV